MRTLFSAVILILIGSTSLALPNGWQQIKPGGSTLCARGAEYSFLVKPGDPQKVLIEFGGGGACWDALSCDNDRVFRDSVDDTVAGVNAAGGIRDANNLRNPYKGWTHVVIPYCTGDLHLGTTDTVYKRVMDNSSFTIHHRGAINTQAVLAWVYANYKAPTDISVNGCSAGSYASVIWTAFMADHYRNSRLLQFGDSGAGVTDKLFFPQWGMQAALPAWIPSLNPGLVDWNNLNLVQVYKGVAEYYPQVQFSQFNHDRDRVQTFFFALMGGATSAWKPRMLKNMEDTSVLPNFHYFVASGANHCAMTRSLLYDIHSSNVALVDWLTNMVKGAPVSNVKCTECSVVK